MSTASERYGGSTAGPGAAAYYAALVLLVSLVGDGWSGRPSPLLHQLCLLPFSVLFAICLCRLLKRRRDATAVEGAEGAAARRGLWVLGAFEILALAGFLYERHHFARFGYGFGPLRASVVLLLVIVAAAAALRVRTALAWVVCILWAYGAGLVLAITSFPLSYLRSDMLPVIIGADQRLVLGLNPYAAIHLGSRLYDFPYLPGMMIAYLPAVAGHVDVRLLNLACTIAVVGLVYTSAALSRRFDAAVLIGVFVLSPFLQYRHDLYLAPHWLALVGALVLMQRRHYAWAATVFGLSMGIYQLSWVLFPFVLLNAFRRRGLGEAAKLTALGFTGMLLLVGPFLAAATRRIAHNTVGQWSLLPHAVADPMNLSYWVTYLVGPDQLKWVQLLVMTAVFGYCVVRGRCASLTDTLRWMSGALALFIALNVLVDGYFYLTLLLLLLLFTCAVTGIWPEDRTLISESSSRS